MPQEVSNLQIYHRRGQVLEEELYSHSTLGEARKTHDNRSKPPATPINADRLDLLLKVTNYNTELRLKLYNGFKKGFDIGFRGIPNSEIVENVQNLSNEKTQAIDDAIRKELENK